MTTKKSPTSKATRKTTSRSGRPSRKGSAFKPTITEKQIYEVLGPRNPLVKRMLEARGRKGQWLVVAEKSTADREEGCIVDYESFRHAYKRLIKGDRPPSLPGERRITSAPESRRATSSAVGRAILRLMELLPHLESIVFRPRTRSFVANWSDGTTEIYKLKRRKNGRTPQVVAATYESRSLECLDSIWSAEQGRESA